MMNQQPIYRANLDDVPRPVAVLALSKPAGDTIPYHHHRRGQLLHAVSGIMRVATAEAAWILGPARALWLPPQLPHSVTMRSHVEIRTVYIDPAACAALPAQPVQVEVGGLLRELILGALEEPREYAPGSRGGQIAELLLTELARMHERPLAVPLPRDPRALRIATALLDAPAADGDLDRWADGSGASRRTLARLFRAETGLSFAEWRAHLRMVEGLARLQAGASVAGAAALVGYASPSAFSAMVRRNLGASPRQALRRA